MPTRKGGHYHIARPDGSGLSQGVDDQGEAESADSNTDFPAGGPDRAYAEQMQAWTERYLANAARE